MVELTCATEFETSTIRVVDNMTMKIIAVVSEKGGAGKTTTVTHVAVAAEQMGLYVVIIDLDPQLSAADWCDRRDGSLEAATVPPSRLEKFLDELRKNGVDLVIIDTPREAHNVAYMAAQCANLVLLPLQPGGFDYRALPRTLDICCLAHKSPWVLLNDLRPGAHLAEADARESVAGVVAEANARKNVAPVSCDVAPAVIHTRTIFRTATVTTKTALETEPDGPAAAEIRALYLWIAQQLDLSTTPQLEKSTMRLIGKATA